MEGLRIVFPGTLDHIFFGQAAGAGFEYLARVKVVSRILAARA
jgi:hypothetical protein